MKTLLISLLKTISRTTHRAPCGLCLALLAVALAPAAWAASPETLTGSGNWTVPAGVTSVTVEMWGGGGGGGAEPSITATGCGSGGGGGGYSRATLTGLTGGVTTFAYSVGGAGSAGLVSGPTAPTAGGNTTFGSVTTAGGGGAGNNSTVSTVGGIAGTGGTANGGAGQIGSAPGQNNGAGGGAGGWNGSAGVVGGTGGAVTTRVGGIGGGTAPSKGGDGGTAVNASVGGTGGSPGGGGAGGSATSAGTANGGPGAAGTIILTYSVAGSPPSLSLPTATAITTTTATLGANVVANSGATIDDYGVVYADTSVNAAPTVGGTGVTQLQKSTTETLGVFTVSTTGLTPGTNYSYAGYAHNSAGYGYSSVSTFTALTNEPTGQASGVSFSSAQRSTFTFSWTRGTGEKCIVLVKAGATVDASPVDGATYTASSVFTTGTAGSGTQVGTSNYVAYLGTGTSVTLSGLAPGTNYYVAVYELNGAAGSENYLTSTPATGNQTATGNTYYSSANAAPTALASWFTGAGGTGSNPTNFSGGDNFIIQNGHTLTATTGWTNSGGATVTINSGGKLDMNTFPFKLGGSFNNNGTFVSGAGVASVTFTASGTITPGVSLVGVVAQGAGGGGAGATATSTPSTQGGGGGGGASAYSASVAVVGTTSYTVTVGAAGVRGTAGTTGNPGNAGGNSQFSGGTISAIIANGGAGGLSGGTGGAGGAAGSTGATANFAGGNAASAGGGGAGDSGAGGAASAGTGGTAGTGSLAAGGAGGSIIASLSGTVGTAPGGGGSGANWTSGAGLGGSSGGAGQVVVIYPVPVVPTVTTPTVAAITDTTATLGATVTANGGSELTSRGTVWDTTASPTANLLDAGITAVSAFTQARTGLPAGTQIFYRGYAVNAVGTNYSADGTFYTLSTAPTTAASAMNFNSVVDTSMTVNWTVGDGARRIVIAKQGSAPSGTPVNGTVYSASATYGSGAALAGGFVVYDGTGSSVTVSGLTASTTYYFVVYEYNVGGNALTADYLTSSSLSSSQATTAPISATIIVTGDPVTLAFGSQGINSTSTNQTYTVSGVNLTADISIAAPSGFEISTSSGSGFGSGLTLTQSGGTVGSTTIYVRFAPTAVTAYSGNVVNSSAGATTVNVAVSGTGAAIAPTVSSTPADNITGTTATLHGSIDADGGATITDRGFVFKTSPGVTISDNKKSGSAAYVAPGTYAWVCPAGVTSVQVECWGGGGAGGSASRNGQASGSACGGGGAGGAYVRSNSFAVTAGNTYYITVGAGGVSSTNDTVKVGGGDSWFNSVNSASSTLIAKGGGGGETVVLQSAANRFGVGGTVTAGSAGVDAVKSGGSGGTSTVFQTGGSGGGSGGTSSAGNPGSATTGVGAAVVTGGGNGGDANPALSGSVPGQKPTIPPGGGGGGARSASAGFQIGGAGADGQVVLTYSGPGAVPMDYAVTGLSPNAVTYWKAYAINSAGTTLSSERSFYTLANVPLAPTVNAATTSSLNVLVNVNGNPVVTEFAIQETNSSLYVQANGTLGGSAVWQTTNVWNGATNFVTVTGLSAGSTYAFQVKARNNDSPQVETAFGPANVRNTVPLPPTATSDSPVCAGSTLHLFATTVTGATNYTWWGPNGFTNNTDQNPTIPSVTSAAAGTYWVTAKREGQTSTSNSVVVAVNTPPTASGPIALGAQTNVLQTLQIIGGKFAPTGTGPLTITAVTQGTNGGTVAITGSGTNVTFISSSLSADSFTYTVTDGNGCTAIGIVNVTVSAITNQQTAQLSFDGSGNRLLLFWGVPGTAYYIQRSTSASDWSAAVDLGPVTANTSQPYGQINYTDSGTASSTAGYYRLKP